jgi:hypothetical protein
MPRPLLDRLDEWKRRFEPDSAARLESLLGAVARRRFSDPADLIRLHETLLFLRAYPLSEEVSRRADEILAGFAERVRRAGLADDEAFEVPEVSGIAGTSLCGVFTYEAACRLSARYPADIEIAWDRHDEIDRMGPVLARIVPLLDEEWPVEAHAPFREWIAAAHRDDGTDLAWLLGRLAGLEISGRERSDLYGSMNLPLLWTFRAGSGSRSGARLPGRARPFRHTGPLIRRSEVSLAEELDGAPLPVTRLSKRAARRAIDLIHDTSASRYRELYGFNHPDEDRVWQADAGRGNEIVWFGVPPEWRLPLRAYHGGMFFKNGVPAGYVEVLSLCERAEVGFNLYYTFREGESAWFYARLLKLCNQMLGVTCFSVDPYQIGHENEEAVASGAFWFYRKLGFRPVEPEAAALTAREERRMAAKPGYRSGKRTLEKLAAGSVIYEGPGSEPGAWDRFAIRNLGFAAQRPGSAGKGLARVLSLSSDVALAEVAEAMQAKYGEDEADYLRLMQSMPRLRAAVLALGCGYFDRDQTGNSTTA